MSSIHFYLDEIKIEGKYFYRIGLASSDLIIATELDNGRLYIMTSSRTDIYIQ